MVQQNFKLVVFGKRIYHEIDLSEETPNNLNIGTTRECQIRFNKDLFFEDFSLNLNRTNGIWQIECSVSIYFASDGIMKNSLLALTHGDQVIVKYQNSNTELFKLNFGINFDKEEKNYERVVDIKGKAYVNIGGSKKCDIFIKNEILGEDTISIQKKGDGYTVTDNQTRFGVYVNGSKIDKTTYLYNYDFFSIAGFSFFIKDGNLYGPKGKHVIVEKLKYMDHQNQNNSFCYPNFNRSSRLKYKICEDPIEVLDPQAKQPEQKRSILLTLVPAILSLALTVVLRGVMGSGGTFVLYSIITMTMGTVVTFITTIGDRRLAIEEERKRVDQYEIYIQEKEAEILESRREELRILNLIHSSMEEIIEEAKGFSRRLFEKSTEDEDFLTVRLGTGDIPSNCPVEYKEQEFKTLDDPLMDLPEQIEEKYKILKDAPIICNLLTSNVVGILGEKNQLYDMLKVLTLDIALRHFHKEVKMFYIFDKNDKDKMMWIRWLKHTYQENIGVRNFVYDKESKNFIFELLFTELSNREAEKKDNNMIFGSYYIIFVYDSTGIKEHPISEYIERASEFGFTFIFFDEYMERLPKGCTNLITINAENNISSLIINEDSDKRIMFQYPFVQEELAEEIALKLGSTTIEEVSLEGTLTKNISLFKLLEIYDVEDLNISKRWNTSLVYKSMAAPLGVKAGGEVICLDLNEKKHGPHGLVAGTTGSGKSEILQSYILSMASLFHPYEIGFVIIDFKGGGMVNQFKNLPHLVGAITNIDGREIDRSLLSIKAELRKRQEIFAQYNVNHIDAYIRKYKEGECDQPLPHLILIVDEFAELKSDQPEFMKELISAARIGRSLGVHLILATQKPSGVVDDQIWSNSKFKLCLKVQNKNDSNEVLKSPLAAEIKEPGRAYLQVGNNEIFDLFQSAYSGASTRSEEAGTTKEFTINMVELSGKRMPVYIQKKQKQEDKGITQLDALVEYIGDYCEKNEIKRLPGICLPSLGEIIRFADQEMVDVSTTDIVVPIGIYDDPSHQYQGETDINFTLEHLFIVGSSQFGKTNLLQTMIRGLAQKYRTDEINLYILDFASMILKTFEALHHVGGVITSSNDDKLKNFIKMMRIEIEYRKEILSGMGISSFSSYKEAGYTELPQIIIMIDNFTAFKELFPQYDEDMLNICREGIAVGISVVLANPQTTGIGYKYLSNFSRRIALYCNDSGEYGNLFDRCRMQPRNIPGRALIAIDKEVYEYQTYLAFEGEKEIDRVASMKEFIQGCNEKYPFTRAKIIPEIPAVLSYQYLIDNYKIQDSGTYKTTIGLEYSSVDVLSLDMERATVLSMSGKEEGGRDSFIQIIMNQFNRNLNSNPVKMYILDDVNRSLKKYEDEDFVESYTLDSNEFEHIITEFGEEAEERYSDFIDEGMEALEEEPLLVALIQNKDVFEAISSNRQAVDTYKKLITKFKAMKILFIFSNIENVAISYNSPDILKQIKENKNMFLFEDLANQKILEIPNTMIREFKKNIGACEGYYIRDNDVFKVKLIGITGDMP